MDFNKCVNCGAEIEPEAEKCPVCGAAILKENSGQGFAGASAPQPQSQSPKKSAFAPSESARQERSDKNTGYDYGCNVKPPLSSGTILIIGLLAVVGLVVAFAASCLGAFLGGAQILDWLGRPRPEEYAMPVIFCGFAFVVASSFTGLMIGYNAGAYICMAAGTTAGRELTLVPIMTMLGFYLVSFAGAVAVTFLGFMAGGRFIFSHTIYYFNILLNVLSCVYVTVQAFKSKSEMR